MATRGDRCSVAVWSLESCHTDSSPATNDAEVPGNQGKHWVTKHRAALSNPMFTLVTIVKVKKTNSAEKQSAGDRQRKLLTPFQKLERVEYSQALLMMKAGSITMILRLTSSQCNGSIMTHCLKKRHMPNPPQNVETNSFAERTALSNGTERMADGWLLESVQHTIVMRRDYLQYIRKYNCFEKCHKNMSVHLSLCFWDVQIRDIITIGVCRPLSKTVRFNVLKVTKVTGTKKQFQKF
ncbi:unnamed protein product [Ranitomeya imitator]|uniref:40S ribosomal protein S11 n=1 Tax=Ranitomeya imitator TaxID=111125 RepID=A0ABN9LAI0_9NEOB|nr:unnamed protein product [Ranitomeya imitator]